MVVWLVVSQCVFLDFCTWLFGDGWMSILNFWGFIKLQRFQFIRHIIQISGELLHTIKRLKLSPKLFLLPMNTTRLIFPWGHLQMYITVRLSFSFVMLTIFYWRLSCWSYIFHIFDHLLEPVDKQFIHFILLHKFQPLLIPIFIRSSPKFGDNNISILIITIPIKLTTIYHTFIYIWNIIS